ncbi:MAG: diaminopimelate decarboxylase [Oscillospiraceae bacterium]|jgi:diaminopimelate decarboxylase|nr:diaminopimelate decarboxylase [Oscillospiraceae bacterium]
MFLSECLSRDTAGRVAIGGRDILELAREYGTPLYVYDETTLRKRCAEMRGLLPGRNFRVSYSAKANSNLELMKIVRSEGLDADAMSPGEIYTQQLAGWESSQILFIPNNVAPEEMRFALDRGIRISVDSLSQLEMLGKLCPGGAVAVRFNPSKGLGHHEKVVTAGKKTKFGVETAKIPEVKAILAQYNLRLVGVTQHLGSLVLTKEPYLAGARELLATAQQFPGLEFIDFGGGFGVPYKEGESRLNLAELSAALDGLIAAFLREYENKNVQFRTEPGRYVPAECGILIGRIHSIKENYETAYIGTDLGFNTLMRPVLYDSYHTVTLAKANPAQDAQARRYTIVGNICESGDIIAGDRALPEAEEGDLIVVETAGAYGYAMTSNYNCRLRPAEVLVQSNGAARLIRRRDTLEALVRGSVE